MNNDKINGLRLPSQIVMAIGDGTWNVNNKDWHAVFPADEIQRPMLYSMNLMLLSNATWLDETRSIFVGVEDGIAIPGVLDPSLSLLIGELDSDSMIALDYRSVERDPSVTFLNANGQWVLVAESFNDFWRLVAGV